MLKTLNIKNLQAAELKFEDLPKGLHAWIYSFKLIVFIFI